MLTDVLEVRSLETLLDSVEYAMSLELALDESLAEARLLELVLAVTAGGFVVTNDVLVEVDVAGDSCCRNAEQSPKAALGVARANAITPLAHASTAQVGL